MIFNGLQTFEKFYRSGQRPTITNKSSQNELNHQTTTIILETDNLITPLGPG